MILLVPLDVSNTWIDGGMDMKTFWYIILMVNAILLFFVLPVGMWFYEAADESIVSSLTQ